MRFAVPANDPRLVALVEHFDRDDVSAAETWRLVGDAFEAIGLRRPSYDSVRRLVRIERRRRELRKEAREIVVGALSAAAVGRTPSVAWTLDRVRELELARELVTQRHKPSRADAWEGEA